MESRRERCWDKYGLQAGQRLPGLLLLETPQSAAPTAPFAVPGRNFA